MFKILIPALAAVAVLAPAAVALEDTATGLKVDLPTKFMIEIAAPTIGYDVLIGVTDASGELPLIGTSPYLCGVAFADVPQNAGMSQAQVNAMIDRPEWGQQARQAAGPMMSIISTEVFQSHGATGVEFIATPKAGPDHANVRLVMATIETPKGRTVVTCTATAATLEKALPTFHIIRDGVTPPG